jgi:mRNA-degrading endonuclease toxin of MazEF toxin-antitoxin module
MMKKLLLISAAAALISTGAMAQSTVVTTTGTGPTAAVQIEPEYRTKIRSYVTEHKIRPIESREKIVVGSPVPREVELEAVPAEWGPSLTKYRYVYSGERVMLVDPSTRTVVQEVE